MAIDIKKGLKAAVKGYKNERNKIIEEKRKDWEINKERYMKEDNAKKEADIARRKHKEYWHSMQWNVGVGVFGALVLWSILVFVAGVIISLIVYAVSSI